MFCTMWDFLSDLGGTNDKANRAANGGCIAVNQVLRMMLSLLIKE